MMNIDFPLILVILVFVSGLIWAVDAIFFAPARNKTLAELRQKFPQWQADNTDQAAQYRAEVAQSATESAPVEYAKSFFPVLFVVFFLRSFLVEPFQIPSGSMIPTLQVGDYILVNKFTYGIRLPVIRTKVLNFNKPERGDVMVFFPPHKNDTYYIKRVVGLPGDKILYRGKEIYINGVKVSREPMATLPDGANRYQIGIESLGEANHLMQVNDARPGRIHTTEVKPGHYFMMGDNRDNSQDSRVWGQVPEQDIVGKAFAIWMHWDSFLSRPSFSRAGGIE
ncbi:MAG: signal peptidase I [Halioglobus sp.]|jgi:signal peptidase I